MVVSLGGILDLGLVDLELLAEVVRLAVGVGFEWLAGVGHLYFREIPMAVVIDVSGRLIGPEMLVGGDGLSNSSFILGRMHLALFINNSTLGGVK